MNDIFMAERVSQKRGSTNNTHENPSKSFEIVNDQKYNSQNFRSNSRSKSRSKENRTKEAKKIKGNDPSNIEELKRQILLKQALIESSKNSRRKSTGGLSSNMSHNASQM